MQLSALGADDRHLAHNQEAPSFAKRKHVQFNNSIEISD
jgi:hypothetical protein